MRRCDRNIDGTPCSAVAVWRPVLELRARRSDVVAPAQIGLAVCDDHKGALEDYLSDAGWQALVNRFAELGLARPKRSRTTLRWEPLYFGGES